MNHRNPLASSHAVVALSIAVVAAVLAGPGCSRKNVLRPNLPPETSVFVQGPINSVSHRVHIYWFGTDVDGSVEAYDMRWVYPPPASQDPPWQRIPCALPGRCTDSLFTVFTGDSGLVTPTFQIRAVDDRGAVDPTPATERFLLTNMAPSVKITNPLRLVDSTYASMTVSWSVNDPDGGGPGLHYRVWLDGNETAYDSTSEQTFTVPSFRFLDKTTHTFKSGYRTLFVRPVDDGGRQGSADSTTWFVRAPAEVPDADGRGKVLLIDDSSARSSNNATFDSFYLNGLGTLPDGSYSLLKIELQPNAFRTARDLAQTLRQFKAVMWYRGFETAVSPQLTGYQDSLGAYVDAGGRLYLDGLYLVEGPPKEDGTPDVPGALHGSFVTQYLGSNGLYRCYSSCLFDSTSGWGNSSGTTASVFRTSAYSDVGRSVATVPGQQGCVSPGIRGFVVRDTQYVALWAMDSQLSPPNTGFEMPVGVTVPRPRGGRLILSSLPLRTLAPAPAGRILQNILNDPQKGLLAP